MWCSICLFSSFIGILDSNFVKLLAIRKACDLCISRSDLAARKILLASDSKVAVSWVLNDDFGSIKHVNIIYEIQSLLRTLGNLKVIFNPRTTNSFNDMLAKKGSSLSGDFTV